MLKELDAQRLNFVLAIGRRFWTACAMLLKHFKNIGISDTFASLNGNYSDDITNDVRIYFDHEDGVFDPFSNYSVLTNDSSETKVYQLFSISDHNMYFNVYKSINFDQFYGRYHDIYSKPIASMYYAISRCVVPIEANIIDLKIKANSGRNRYIDHSERYPLIDVLYQSNEMVEFVKYLTSVLMFSTHMYYAMYNDISENISDSRRNYSSGPYKLISGTWDMNMIHFKDFFSSCKRR